MSEQSNKPAGTAGEEQKASTEVNQTDKSITSRQISLEKNDDIEKAQSIAQANKDSIGEENKEPDQNFNGHKGPKRNSLTNEPEPEKRPDSPEFNSLKDIDGLVIRHDESEEEEEEDPNQKVHFKIDGHEEEEPENPAQPHLNRKPRKSILKRSGSVKSTASADKKDTSIEGTDHAHGEFGTNPESHGEPIKDSLEFLSAWKGINHDLRSVERFFISQAEPKNFSTIFANGIETELLSEIITATNDLCGINSGLALKVLTHLTDIKDFENVSKSLSDKEKIDIHTIFMKLRASLGLEEESLTSISGKYLA